MTRSDREPPPVVMVHNYYQHPGGEDQSFLAEATLLEDRGHRVIRYTRHNNELIGRSSTQLAMMALWNHEVYGDLRRVVRGARAQFVIFQNTFPIISPAAYYAAKAERAAVVQVLRNYRLICPTATLFRDGRSCELCVRRRVKWPGVLYGCYRRSRWASTAVSLMLFAHRTIGTWSRAVDMYVALTEIQREKHIAGGIPPGRIVVRPNFVDPDPGLGSGDGGYALFVGRLTTEKGIETLLDAWESLSSCIPLKIVGDGPLAKRVRERCDGASNVQWLGHRTSQEVLDMIGRASILMFPSLWYEGMPRTVIEAFSRATPVIAFDMGAMRSMVQHRRNGLLVSAGDVRGLAEAVNWTENHPDELRRMRRHARETYEAKYTSAVCYDALLGTLERAREIANVAMRSAALKSNASAPMGDC